MDYNRDYLVHYYEADSRQRLTLPSLVRYFEDVAILHSARQGLNLEHYHDSHCGWMLLKRDITVRNLPSFAQTVRVGTRVNAIRKFLADRRFVMTDEGGAILAEGSSNWLLVDTDRRRPMKVPEDYCARFSVSSDSESSFVAIDDVVFPSPVPADSESRPVRVGYGDIDTNSHVNNVSYLGWSLDSLPHDFFNGRAPSRMRAQYRKELVVGNEATVVSSVAENAAGGSATTRHSVRSGEDECCSLEIEWAPVARSES
ncbi:MAG TPA: thioesterase [Treponemataceae bacterium]|nr:thioesterase [Treponemataceae bacterium]